MAQTYYLSQAPPAATVPGPPPPPPTLIPVELELHAYEAPLRRQTWRTRILASVFVALSLLLFIVAGGLGHWDLYSIPMLAWVGLWNSLEFIVYHMNGRGSHPGCHVAVDLVAWTNLLWPATISIVGGYTHYHAHDLLLAAASLELVASAFHLILFIMACVATERRRKWPLKQLISMQRQIIAWQVSQQAVALPPYLPQVPVAQGNHIVSTGPQTPELQVQNHPSIEPASITKS